MRRVTDPARSWPQAVRLGQGSAILLIVMDQARTAPSARAKRASHMACSFSTSSIRL